MNFFIYDLKGEITENLLIDLQRKITNHWNMRKTKMISCKNNCWYFNCPRIKEIAFYAMHLSKAFKNRLREQELYLFYLNNYNLSFGVINLLITADLQCLYMKYDDNIFNG